MQIIKEKAQETHILYKSTSLKRIGLRVRYIQETKFDTTLAISSSNLLVTIKFLVK